MNRPDPALVALAQNMHPGKPFVLAGHEARAGSFASIDAELTAKLSPPVAATGRMPEMLQDCDRGLSRWLSNRIDSRQHAKEAGAAILSQPLETTREQGEKAAQAVLRDPVFRKQCDEAQERELARMPLGGFLS